MMECHQMKPAEMRETVQTIWRVRSAQELDNRKMEKRVRRLFDVVLDCSQKQIAEPAASQYIDAFLSGNPSKAYRNLVELRSGRSLSDQSDQVGVSAVPVDLDNKDSHFSVIYRKFTISYLNSMPRPADLYRLYLSGGCVEAALRELNSAEFKEHKNDSPDESRTAWSIRTHLGLIYNVSTQPTLQPQLCAELQSHSHVPVLKEFTLSKYVHYSFYHLLAIKHF